MFGFFGHDNGEAGTCAREPASGWKVGAAAEEARMTIGCMILIYPGIPSCNLRLILYVKILTVNQFEFEFEMEMFWNSRCGVSRDSGGNVWEGTATQIPTSIVPSEDRDLRFLSLFHSPLTFFSLSPRLLLPINLHLLSITY